MASKNKIKPTNKNTLNKLDRHRAVKKERAKGKKYGKGQDKKE